jgi:hypothetical protein
MPANMRNAASSIRAIVLAILMGRLGSQCRNDRARENLPGEDALGHE